MLTQAVTYNGQELQKSVKKIGIYGGPGPGGSRVSWSTWQNFELGPPECGEIVAHIISDNNYSTYFDRIMEKFFAMGLQS
jgi:hypothetical protein